MQKHTQKNAFIWQLKATRLNIHMWTRLSKIAYIHRFFKPISSLPHCSGIGIGEQVARGKITVQKVIEQPGTAGKWKQKAYTAFTDKQWAKWPLCSRKWKCSHFEEVHTILYYTCMLWVFIQLTGKLSYFLKLKNKKLLYFVIKTCIPLNMQYNLYE